MKKEHSIRIDRTKLHPWLNYKIDALLKACEKRGIYLIITEGFRTKEYQNSLYAKGRTAPGSIVTQVSGSSYGSQHMWGIAFDIAINDTDLVYDYTTIKRVAKLAKKLGLGWGGDWKGFTDTPHFYLKQWGDTPYKLKSMYGTPENFMKTWSGKVYNPKKAKSISLWNSTRTRKLVKNIPNGTKMDILYTKSWYKKVIYKGKVGYVIKKYLI